MATRRRDWNTLSPAYQKRLLLNGIGPQKYKSGASLAKARGKGSQAKENAMRRARRAGVKVSSKEYDKMVAAYGNTREVDDLLRLKAQAVKEGSNSDELFAAYKMRPLDAQQSWYWYH